MAFGIACLLTPVPGAAQSFEIIGGRLQDRASGVLALMGYSLTPDVTTGSLAFSNATTGNPDFAMTSFGGGFTISTDTPLYLEGTAAYSRYDPTFVATDGQQEQPIPTKWNSLSATGGVGWDFRVAQDLVLRPIFNFTLGQVATDASLLGGFINFKTGKEIEFLQNGRLNAYGLGGSLMLDYERYRPDSEIDVELRFTDIVLQSYGDSSAAVEGSADATSLGLWSRWRAPTGYTLMERPLRYVLEYAHTTFLGDLDGVLGFNHLNSLGAGIEFDSSQYDIIVTRTRLVARYKFGDNVTGWSLGLAISF